MSSNRIHFEKKASSKTFCGVRASSKSTLNPSKVTCSCCIKKAGLQFMFAPHHTKLVTIETPTTTYIGNGFLINPDNNEHAVSSYDLQAEQKG